MSQYVIGETGRRKLNSLFQQSLEAKRRLQFNASHAIDNKYPYPYEVRWSESQLSSDGEAGGYIIWLPDYCLYLNNTAQPPRKWAQVSSAKLYPNLSTDHWYKLENAVLGDADINSLSSWDLYLNTTGQDVLLSVAEYNSDSRPKNTDWIHIATVQNKRSKPNVKSVLILGNRNKPFELEQSISQGSDNFYYWVMQNNLFEYNGQTIAVANCAVPDYPSVGKEPVPAIIRLVHLKNPSSTGDEWTIDRVAPSSINSLQVGEVLLTQTAVQEGDEAQGVYPLYTMDAFNGVQLDMREAWYIIDDIKLPDDWTITLSGDVNFMPEHNLFDGLSSQYHLWHWYDHANDINSLPADLDVREWCFPIRYEQYEDTPVSSDQLRYLTIGALRDWLKLSSDTPGDGYPPWKDLSGSTLSSLSCDEESISKGEDGWPGLSSLNGPLHLWHFHDEQATVANPEMCDFVLRYNPDRADDDKWLRYCPLSAVEEKLKSDLSAPIEDMIGNMIDVSIDDKLSGLSAELDSGMFKWNSKTRTMGVGGVMVGRQWVTASGTGSKSDGFYSVCVTINANGSYGAAVVNNASLGQAPTTTQCWIPIYQISGGIITADYRGAFVVPAFD